MWNLNSLLRFDSTVLDGISLPSGMSTDLCKSSIIMKCGLLQPIYGEPDVFKSMVETWFAAKSWNIEHLWKMCEQEYNPIHNFDRHEVNSEDENISHADKGSMTESNNETSTNTGNSSTEGSNTNTESNTGTDATTSHDADTTNTTTENSVAAFNSAEYQNKDRAVVNGHAETNGNTTLEIDRNTKNEGESSSVTKSTNDIESIGSKSGSNESTHTETNKRSEDKHMYGNIGVTTTQQMMTAEINLMGKFNIYEWIANMFESDLFITVY